MPSGRSAKNWYIWLGNGHLAQGKAIAMVVTGNPAQDTGYRKTESTELIGASSYAQVGLRGVRVVRGS